MSSMSANNLWTRTFLCLCVWKSSGVDRLGRCIRREGTEENVEQQNSNLTADEHVYVWKCLFDVTANHSSIVSLPSLTHLKLILEIDCSAASDSRSFLSPSICFVSLELLADLSFGKSSIDKNDLISTGSAVTAALILHYSREQNPYRISIDVELLCYRPSKYPASDFPAQAFSSR